MKPLKIVSKTLLGVLVLGWFAVGCDEEPGSNEYRKALENMRDGNYVVGRSLMEKSLRLQPREAPAAVGYNYLGTAYLNLGDEEKARKAFQVSRQLDPTLAEPVYNLGVVSFRKGDYALASKLFQESAGSSDEPGKALHYAGVAELNQGNWVEAERLLDAARVKESGSVSILVSLALAHLRTEGPGRAIADLDDAIAADPNYGPAYFNLALIHDRWLGETQDAVESLERFLVKSTDEARIQQARQMLAAAGRGLESSVSGVVTGGPLPDVKEGSRPEQAVSNSFPDLPEPEPPPADVVDVVTPPVAPVTNRIIQESSPAPSTAVEYMQQAQREAARGDKQTALETFRRAAVMAEQGKDPVAEERVLKAAVLSCPNQAGSYFDYGRFLFRTGDYEKALRAYKKAMALDPAWSAALVGLAEAAIKTEQFETAAVAFERSLRIDPSNSDALWYLALLYDHHLQDPDEALNTYREFIRKFNVDERAPKAVARLAQLESETRTAPPVALVEPGEPAEFRPDSTTATDSGLEANPGVRTRLLPPQQRADTPSIRSRNPESAADWYQRGLLYKARSDWAKAVEHFQNAIEMDDTFYDAYVELGDVYRKQGDPRSALQVYRSVLLRNPRLVAPRYNVALIYHESGKNEAALTQIKEILSIQRNHAPSHYLLGVMYAEHPKTQHLATKHFRIFVRLVPNDDAAGPVRTWLQQHGARP